MKQANTVYIIHQLFNCIFLFFKRICETGIIIVFNQGRVKRGAYQSMRATGDLN